jgi:hypothetical protein
VIKRLYIAYLRSVTLFIALSLVALTTNAQKEELKNSIIEQRIEQIAGTLEEGAELDYTTLLEDLTYYFEHPLNLNTATVEELRELYLLSDFQINNLQRHIKSYGPLLSMYELQAVEGFDLPTIRSIEYFVTVKPSAGLGKVSLQTILNEAQSDLFLRYKRTVEKQKGYQLDPKTGEIPFAGSPDYFYTRYRVQFRKNLRAGFTLEQDAGESVKNGIDFTSFHIMYSNQGWLRKLVVGDYQALFGQGLTFWNGLGFGKSPFVLNAKKNAVGLRPYSSVQEFNYLRGGAATLGWKDLEFTAFYSSKKLDGTQVFAQDTLITDDEGIITNMQISGLHRTANEIANRGNLTEQVTGGNLRYGKRTWSIGTTAAYTQYSSPIQPDLNLYQQFRFTGTENLVVGLDYQAVVRNVNFFGETSRSKNGGMATLNGLVAALHPRLAVSLVHRYFARDYQNMHVNVFGENNTAANNENGLFAGVQTTLNSKWTMTGYADLVKYPWMRYRVDAPGVYTDYMVQLNYKPDRKHEFYLRYRLRDNEQNSSLDDLLITYPSPVKQQNWRLHSVYQAHPNVQMKTRVEFSKWNKESNSSNGFLLYQDIIYKKLGSKWSLTARYAMFDTPDWNSRLYAYESDVLYAFSIPAYAGKGTRFYTLLKVDVMRGLDLWVRYATFIYNDRQRISSGNNEISGNQKTDIHVQLRWQF